MPEYLSPGVFIEEIPARLKAIEGVSTSTGGFVGAATRGPIAGAPVPFNPVAGDPLPVPQDASPILVTSLSDFTRQFGRLFDSPQDQGYLGHSVRAFFDNGGKRCYVSRVANAAATRATLQVDHGTMLRLARPARVGDVTLFLNSLRGIDSTGAIELRRVSDGSIINAAHGLANASTPANSVTLAAALVAADVNPTGLLTPDECYVVPAGGAFTAAAGPVFHARSAGEWGNELRVLITPSDRTPNAITVGANAGDTVLQVASTASFYRGAIVEVDFGAPGPRGYHIVDDLLPGNRLQLDSPLTALAAVTGFARVAEIDIVILDRRSGAVETFRGLSWNPDPAREVRAHHYATALNLRSRFVYAQPPGFSGLGGAETAAIADQPVTDRSVAMGPPVATLGVDGGVPGDADFIGVDGGPGLRTGIQSLADAEDIRIIAAPGVTTRAVQAELIGQAERLRYRFAVIDGELDPPGPSIVNGILARRNDYDSSYAAYYTPWPTIEVGDRVLRLPPSGYIAGIYARTDNDRGVWKAPANEVVRGITGLSFYITTGEQDVLNPRGVNAIRRFEGRGIRVWGGRTLSSDPEWRYVNVRRFMIFLEASLDRGTQWVVFEPNAPETWSRVVDSVSAFLHTQWRSGALFGRKPEDSFFVRCDESTMTVDDVQNGRLICEIGVAIVRPAEFVIFRIEQITGFGTRS